MFCAYLKSQTYKPAHYFHIWMLLETTQITNSATATAAAGSCSAAVITIDRHVRLFALRPTGYSRAIRFCQHTHTFVHLAVLIHVIAAIVIVIAAFVNPIHYVLCCELCDLMCELL